MAIVENVLYPFHPQLWRQVRIQENDDVYKVCKAAKMSEEELKSAYYKDVNVSGASGIHSDRNRKWPPVFEAGKIFYVPTEPTLNKRRNFHELSNLTTPIRCMYNSDEPMKNRYILFWEVNDSGNGFRDNGSGMFYGREDINEGETKPIGLGITDGDGILNGNSLCWITDSDQNSIFFENDGKFPEHHVSDVGIGFKVEIDVRSSDKYPEGSNTFFKSIGSSFKHNILKYENIKNIKSCDVLLYNFGNSNYVWGNKVSKFVNFYKYAFMPFPVDVFNEKSFNTKNLFAILKEYIKTTIPERNVNYHHTRTFEIYNKLALNKKMQQVGTNTGGVSTFMNFFEIPQGTHFDVNNCPIRLSNFKEYKPQSGFKIVPEIRKREFLYNDPDITKTITEEMVVKEIVFDKLSLPEWVGRIKSLRLECDYLFDKLKKMKQPIVDHIQKLMHLSVVSKIRAMYPYTDSFVDSTERIRIANQIPDDFLKLKKNINKYFICDNPAESKAKEVYEQLVEKTNLLRTIINSSELYNEVKRYIGTRKTKQWPHLYIEFLDDSESTKKEKIKNHLEKIANSLCKEIEKSYCLYRDMDIFDINSMTENKKTFFERIYEEDLYIVLKKISEAEQKKVHFNNTLFFLLNDNNVATYITNAEGPSSLLFSIIDITKHIFTKLEKGRFANYSFNPHDLEYLCICIFQKISKEETGKSDIRKVCKYKTNIRESMKSIKTFVENLKNIEYKFGNVGSKGFDIIIFLLQFRAFKLNLNEGNYKNAYTLSKDILDTIYKSSDIGLSTVTIFKELLNPEFFNKTVHIFLLLQISVNSLKLGVVIANDSGDIAEKNLLITDIGSGFASLLVYIITNGASGGTIFVASLLYLVIIGINIILTRWIKGGPLTQYIRKSFNTIVESNEYIYYQEKNDINSLIHGIFEKIDSLKNKEFEKVSWRGAVPLISCGFVKYNNKGLIDVEATNDILEDYVGIKIKNVSDTVFKIELKANGIPYDSVVKMYKYALESPKKNGLNNRNSWEKGEIMKKLNPAKRVFHGYIIYDNVNNNWFSEDMEKKFY